MMSDRLRLRLDRGFGNHGNFFHRNLFHSRGFGLGHCLLDRRFLDCFDFNGLALDGLIDGHFNRRNVVGTQLFKFGFGSDRSFFFRGLRGGGLDLGS